ncbi:MAG: MoxR family ATPase [Lachnospiraceae bacterium]|nr:MoxR family ATPase [Lachnospiraceae bacterium]
MGVYEKLEKVLTQINQIVIGKEDVTKKVFAAIIAGGHVLLEDIPGVGKTTLSSTFAKVLSLNSKRIQFTPDVLPSDLLGFSMYNEKTGEFEYREGAVFCNLFLGDEINRTSPKTQSALLEVMEERQVSVDGTTRKIPEPFIVIATENPIGSSGTQMLPESQLDRFMICVSMGYPKHEEAVRILKGAVWNKVDKITAIMDKEQLKQVQDMAENVFVSDELFEYIVSIVEATRTSDYCTMGASPRASIGLLKMTKAMAVLEGRDFTTAGDVKEVAKDVLGHRVKLSTRARAEGIGTKEVIELIVRKVPVPKM